MSIPQFIAAKGGYSNTLVVITALVISLVAFMFGTIVYRLWFHPLAKIPGPKYMAVCDVFSQWRTFITLDMSLYMVDLHRKYGPIVRIGPNRLAMEGSIAWPQVYSVRSSSDGTEFGKQRGYLYPTDHLSLLGANKDDHRRQRRQLNHAFSAAALHEQEHIVMKYINQFISILTEKAKKGEVLNIVDWINYTTFDIIGDLCFADAFHGLDGDTAYVQNAFRGLIGTHINRFLWHFPLMKVPLMLMLGTKELAIALEAGRRNSELGRLKGRARMAMGAEPKDGRRDFATYMLREGKNGEKILSESEVEALSSILVVAGSETTGTALAGFVYLITHNPDKKRVLQDEIRSAFTNEAGIDITNTGRLEYLNAVIEETMRMYPPASSLTPRVSPGAEIEGYWLPRGLRIHVYSRATYRNPLNFTDPDSFHPERWLSPNHPRYNPRFAHDRREVFKPFSAGNRDCIGKNLAYAEMRLTISKLVYRFDIELLPGQDDWLDSQRTTLVMLKPALNARFNLRPGVALD
ncbi:cytochrome P450 [Colletotrichum somersetense]|nr:cytochrome P450 [Colletotrichum somersetense]